MSIRERVRRNRHSIERELYTSPRRRFFSPAYYSQYEVTVPLIRRFVRGRLIDLGCGSMPYRALIADRVSAYDGLDFFHDSPEVTYRGDIQDMSMIESESYDSAICLEVLEHVLDPFRAAREIYRILKRDGVLILSVPHLSRLHSEPHDYYRFTRYGLRYLLENAGFTIQSLEKRGGLFSFLGHQLATLLLGIVWTIPVLKSVIWFMNSWLITRACYKIDQILDTSGIYAMGYTVVGCKNSRSGVDDGTRDADRSEGDELA